MKPTNAKQSPAKIFLIGLLLGVGILLGACQQDDEAAPTEDALIPTLIPTAAPELAAETASEGDAVSSSELLPAGTILFSEIQVGLQGNNNFEFIELYNPTAQSVDLRGYSIQHQLPDKEAERLHLFTTRSDIPAYGHFLLVREGEDIGILPDATFAIPIFSKGVLTLLDQSEEIVDQIGWGEAAAALLDSPAETPPAGQSIERLPGNLDGNGDDSDISAADFAINDSPAPQNSGSATTPALTGAVTIEVVGPAEVTPGATFVYEVSVTNLSGSDAADVVAFVPLHPELQIGSLPAGAQASNNRVEWVIGALADGDSIDGTIELIAPLDYFDTVLRGYYAETSATRSYGELMPLAIAGGSIPVGTARLREGATVTVEGIATMFTDGFFAGTTGTKFYLQDESGGVQVYCPGGKGDVEIQIGDRVRVTGYIEIYRTSTELIPCASPDDIEIISSGEMIDPTVISIADALNDVTTLGNLNQITGTITRLEEFSFSYEIDLQDAEGNTLLVYVDKLTEINPESIQVGSEYHVTGLSESWDGNIRIMPRTIADFDQIFPPVLALSVSGPFSAPAGATISYTLTATNYTDQPLSDIALTTSLPSGDIAPDSLTQTSNDWEIDRLEADGGTMSITYSFTISESASGILTLPSFITGNQTVETVITEPLPIYIGNGVPIWAIQGSGNESPYVRNVVATEGVVIGVFPGLGGFWIQAEPDGDETTSDGLFILADGLPVGVQQLDQVVLFGAVRELSGQTMIELESAEDLVIVGRATALPAPVELSPPADEEASAIYYEALEGMLVTVTQNSIAVGPTSRFGEYAVVLESEGETRVMKGEDRGYIIYVDDGTTFAHEDQSTLDYVVTTGDSVSGLIGPLAFTFGNFKIEPIAQPVVIAAQRSLPAPVILGANEFSIATYNVENLFDTMDPHPTSPPRPSGPAYEIKLAKTADAILTMGVPTIIALQEVENIGVLEDLAAHELLAPYGYVAALIEGDDSRGIDVGYLVRAEFVTIHSVTAHPGPDGITSRHPLVLEATITLPAGSLDIFVINNHFTSMSGGELATEPRRLAQAQWNVTLAQQILAENPDANVVITGDLNSFLDSPPMDAIRDAGFVHVYGEIPSDSNYSYIFEGESETLDHIFLSPELNLLFVQVHAVHINADFPLAVPGDPSAQRASDHDPIVAVFIIP